MGNGSVGGNYQMPVAPYQSGTDQTNAKTRRFNEMISTNEQGVAELTATELQEIANWDGQAGLSATDFQAAGVNATVARDLVQAARPGGSTAFQTVGLNFTVPQGSNEFIPPRLSFTISNPLRETLLARPGLGVNTIPAFDAKLKTMSEPARNTLLASVTQDVAAEMFRTQSLSTNAAVFNKYLTVTTENGNTSNITFKALPSTMSATDMADAIFAVTNHPDMPQEEMHRALDAIGTRLNANPTLKQQVLSAVNTRLNLQPPLTNLTDVRDRNTLIQGQRRQNLSAISTTANNLYTTFGGTNPRPTTLTLATGDGTTTVGRNGRDNRGIALNRYGNTSGFLNNNANSGAVTGMDQARVTFQPTAGKPMSINILPSGANMPEGTASAANGNRLSVEYRDARGNAQSIDFITYHNPQTNLTEMKLANPITDPNITFDAGTGTLTFKNPGSQPVSILQRSGGTATQKDEIFATVTVTGAAEVSNNEVNIGLRDHFRPNQWDVNIEDMPEFSAKVREVVAFRKANHVPDPQADVQGHGAGTLVNGQVTKRSGGDFGSGGYAQNNTTAAGQSHLRYSELSYNMKTGQIEVDSFTDPVHATLAANGFADQVAMMRTKDASLTENDILSGLRAFSVYEAFENEARANGDSLHHLETLQVPIGTNGAVMTFADYQAFNAQRTALGQ